MDKRLLELSIRRAETRPDQLAELVNSLPDLSQNLRKPTDEELEHLRQELAAQSSQRAERIARQMQEDRTPRQQAPVAVVPFDAEL
jgi:hypothetical protein